MTDKTDIPKLDSITTETAKSQEPLSGAQSDQESPVRGTRVLVVDDNEDVLEIIEMMLLDEHCDVTVTNSGEKSIKLFTDNDFDLVIMDCQMPEMNGFEAVVEIRNLETAGNLGHTPIVALTAFLSKQQAKECSAAGMDDSYTKPISQSTLKDLLDKWLPEQELLASA